MIIIKTKRLSELELKLLNFLINASQKELLRFLPKYLNEKYGNIYATPKYIIGVGNIPVALVAHLDTVHAFSKIPKDIYYDTTQGVIWSPDGLGADDRAGVYGIIKILEAGYRPTVIFTTDEETGALGAQAVIDAFKTPVTDLKYIIELDRRGATDCVFYDCNNPEFQDYIESFGFISQWGTFSDISEICPAWKVAGVNLSIGYENEHTKAELLKISWLNTTITKVCKMLEDIGNAQAFKYIHSTKYSWYSAPGWDDEYRWESLSKASYQCHHCKKTFLEPDVVKVKQPSGKFVFYCIDCLDGGLEFCDVCQELYELDPKHPSPKDCCPHCYQKVLKESAKSNEHSKNKKRL